MSRSYKIVNFCKCCVILLQAPTSVKQMRRRGRRFLLLGFKTTGYHARKRVSYKPETVSRGTAYLLT